MDESAKCSEIFTLIDQLEELIEEGKQGFLSNKLSILLRIIKQNATIPIITKLANAKTVLNTLELSLLEKDIYASHLYEQIVATKFHTNAINEYLIGPIIQP